MRSTARALFVVIAALALLIAACGGPGTTDQGGQGGSGAPTSDAVAEFYSGNTVRILVGSPPGGGFDTYARTLAKYLPAYIPGEPTVIVENAEGNAGELLVANSLFNTERQDGTVIGTFAEGTVLQDALGGEGVEFESAEFNWLGAATKGIYGCIARRDSGVTAIEDVITGDSTLTLGTGGPESDLYGVPNIIKNRLGANFDLISGYGGFADLLLATESGEVDGFCATYETIVARAGALFQGDPIAAFILVTGETAPATVQDVPTWMELADDEETRALFALADAPREMSKPYAFGPDVPADRIDAMRSAFSSAFADTELIQELEDAGLSVQFSSGEETAGFVDQIFSAPQNLLDALSGLTNE